MRCERLNCGQCLSVMALRNQTSRLKTFLTSYDKSQPFDPYFVVALTSLPRFIRFSHNEGENILQREDYLLLHPNDPHLSFNELSPSLMHPNQPWNYQVRHFYGIIFNCKSVDPDIVTKIISSDCFNPLQRHQEIWRVYKFAGLDWDSDDNFHTILKPVSLISTLAPSEHRNHLTKIITKTNINSSFSATIEWPYYRITDTSMRPSVGWWFKHYQNDGERNLFGKSLFIFLTQTDRGFEAGQNSHRDYRYRTVNQLID